VYPIPAKQKLFLLDIANHWSREIEPRMKLSEVLDGLVKAWWRGDLKAANGPSRPEMLWALYKDYQDRIAFIVPGLEEPSSSTALPDGGVAVFRLWTVPLPNTQPNLWDDTNCAEAFEAVAEAWDYQQFEIVALSVFWIQLTVAEFMSWIDESPYPAPTFWQIAEERDEAKGPIKSISGKSARKHVQAYMDNAKAAGQRATQAGLEDYAREQRLHGGRECLRKEFKALMKAAGVEVKRGRIPNSR
jgi:hypothetical protein